MDEKIKNEKAQAALWIIIALAFAALLGVFFLISNKGIILPSEEYNPQKIIEKCTKDSVNEAIEKMLPQGGFLEPKNYKLYKNVRISYLCENIGYFKTCINQHPLLLNEMKKEILGYLEPRLDKCFSDMKSELERRNSKVEMGVMNISLSFAPNSISLFIQRKITLSKEGQSSSFEEFNVGISSPAYEIANVAMNIANEEAKYCYFEYLGYMLLYPRWDIRKTTLSDSTKIYNIIDKYSNKEMNIAIRGCALPPGI